MKLHLISQQPAASRQATRAGQASPGGTPMTMPLAAVITGVPAGQYVTLGMANVAPLWTTDGAAIPASSPNRWGQLAQAGRP